jgi:AbrB family looped-hinge helix DNA binding protein
MPLRSGKMPFMNATAEIDKAGRLVVPKKLRDALHLVPGTRVTLREEHGEIVIALERKPRGLYMQDGLPVYETGRVLPADHVNWVDRGREERIDQLSGL